MHFLYWKQFPNMHHILFCILFLVKFTQRFPSTKNYALSHVPSIKCLKALILNTYIYNFIYLSILHIYFIPKAGSNSRNSPVYN